jgi:cell division protein FtsN
MKKSRRSSSKSRHGLWLITGLLILIVIAGLFYLKNQKTTTHEEQSNKHAAQVKTTPTQNKPEFDFYTVLPGKETSNLNANTTTTKPTTSIPVKTLPTPNSAQSPTNNQSTPKKTATASSGTYVLQIAAVKSFSDADSLKAQLTLQGYDVKITKIKVGSTTWNRVDVGPYTSLAAAQAAQADLKKLLNKSSVLQKQK